MADKIDKYAKALDVLSGTAALKDTRDGLMNKIIQEGLLKQVYTYYLDTAKSSEASSALTEASSVVLAQSTSESMSIPSSVAAGDEHEATLLQPCSVAANPGCHDPRHPKVVIQKRRPCDDKSQRRKDGSSLLSHFQWRALTESSEENCPNTGPGTGPDDSSEDELVHDNPRPVQSRIVPPLPPTMHSEPIGWVFWTQSATEAGHWRPLSDFLISTQKLFIRKFKADYFDTPSHVELYACMLRRREVYVTRDMCVGNVTHTRRSEPNQWKKANGDKQKACDTCVNTRRFCARAVKVNDVVKLGFFPVHREKEQSGGGEELRHWVKEKEESEL